MVRRVEKVKPDLDLVQTVPSRYLVLVSYADCLDRPRGGEKGKYCGMGKLVVDCQESRRWEKSE